MFAGIFVNEKILEGYCVKVHKIDPYIYEHYKQKIQVDKNGCKYILFRIDLYFIEYPLAVKIDENNMLKVILFLKRKEKKH